MIAATAATVLACGATTGSRNLKVLPRDISSDELGELMLENLRGLGLPRLEGRGCLHCHVGSLDTPRSEWDYASDEKLAKRKARTMMQMVQAINRDYVGSLEHRLDPMFRVTCETCHAGRVDPRPLPDILRDAYAAAGTDSLRTQYRALRERYYGADAYDFRPGVLQGIAFALADSGKIDDGIAVAAVDVEANPDNASVRRAWMQLRLERALARGGVPAAVAALDSAAPGFPAGVYTSALLDGLGWRLRRTNRMEAGTALIMANFQRFPGDYVATESAVFVLHDAGQRDRAYALLEAWLRDHPDHDRARRLLTNLRSRDR